MAYRKGVAVIILSKDKKSILLGERSNERGQWQIPQGGAERGESILQTLEREFYEEIGVALPKILRKTKSYIRYEWPKELLKRHKFIGQEHIYFVVDGSKIDVQLLKPTDEFANFRWFPISEVLAKTVHWKQSALEEALRELTII